jgi:hypothetical protein
MDIGFAGADETLVVYPTNIISLCLSWLSAKDTENIGVNLLQPKAFSAACQDIGRREKTGCFYAFPSILVAKERRKETTNI